MKEKTSPFTFDFVTLHSFTLHFFTSFAPAKRLRLRLRIFLGLLDAVRAQRRARLVRPLLATDHLVVGLHQLVGLEVALGLQLARGQLVALHALGQEAQVDAFDEVVQAADGSLYGVGSRALDAG